jgi:hypothetical protein
MKDLEFGFVIWLGSLVLPLIGFILEWLKLLQHFLIMKFILAAYFERKQAETSESAQKRIGWFNELKPSARSPYHPYTFENENVARVTADGFKSDFDESDIESKPMNEINTTMEINENSFTQRNDDLEITIVDLEFLSGELVEHETE